jgi:hypothetical protein
VETLIASAQPNPAAAGASDLAPRRVGTDDLSRVRSTALAMSTAIVMIRPVDMDPPVTPDSSPPSAAEFRCLSFDATPVP